MAIGAVESWRQGPATTAGDDELVREVLAGGATRFGLLFQRHRERLGRAVRGVLRNRAEADDVVQQTFLLAFTGLRGWAGSAPFSVWLTRIAVNEALMRLRRSRRAERAASQLAVRGGGQAPTPEQAAVSREEVATLDAALARLPPRHRELLLLAALHELSRADLARRFGVSEAAVKVRLHRARGALRRLLGERPARGRPPHLVVAPGRPRFIRYAAREEPRLE